MQEVLEVLIYRLFNSPENVSYGIVPLVAGALISGAVSLIGTGISAISAGKQRRAAEKEKLNAQDRMAELEGKRQPIINPYSNVKDISGMATDLSSMVSNPYANLGVATQSAEMQMEQTDIALANTLDTLRASGASAGGATALAQAALQSKKGVAASIEQQEAQNEKLKAQGEQNLQATKMAEAQRIQQLQLSEAGRMQEADIMGQKYVFENEDRRLSEQLDRAAGQETQAMVNKNAASANQASAIAGGLSAVGNVASSFIQNYTPSAPKVNQFDKFQNVNINTSLPSPLTPIRGLNTQNNTFTSQS